VVPEVSSNPQPEPEQPAAAPAVEEPKPAANKPAAAAAPAPVKKPATKATTTASQTKPAVTEKKDDSKIGSILKKTGRILKKPFKL
jgi:hypothetical protein